MDSEVEQDLVVPGTTADVEHGGQADEAQFLSGVSLPAAAVSLLAFAAAVLHVALPSLEIDTTTLALLGIAALPWLAPFLKSVTLPGGFELVLQDLQRQVRHVRTEVQDGNRRVDELAATIENLVFTGEAVPPDEREGIAAALGGFRAFLTSAGLPVARTEPDVKFDHEATYPYYAPNDDGSAELVVSPGMPTEAILRPYANHLLAGPYAERDDERRMDVQSGLAYYFIGSYLKVPRLPFEGRLEGLTLRDLPAAGTDQHYLFAGAAWADLLWEFRTAVPPTALDGALAGAWLRSVGYRGDFYRSFAKRLVESVREATSPSSADEVRHQLAQNGVKV